MHCVLVKGKEKIFPVANTTKAHVVVEVCGQLYALFAVPPVPTEYEVGWAIGLVWALGEEGSLLPLLGIKHHS
jgi:hypothetical protein